MSNVSKTQFEVLPTTTGDCWRVRIVELERIQYINGFESQAQAEDWVMNEAEAWLNKLRRLAIAPLSGFFKFESGSKPTTR
jgi:3-deoxy-D-manno-octulosonic-acid transferase